MFNVLKGLTKAVVSAATLPIDIVADVITIGGTMTDQEKPYTAKKLEKMIDGIDEATD